MSAPTSPRLDCPTPTANYSHDAEQARPEAEVGAPKGIAEGVPSAVGPGPRQGDGRTPVGWLTIRTPRGAVPTATSWCACGRDLFAAGHRKVLALAADHTNHRDTCPLRTTSQEGRAAA